MRIRFLNDDMPGLTFQGPLAQFWGRSQEQRPEFELWWAFRCVLIGHYHLVAFFMNATGAPPEEGARQLVTFGRESDA